MGGVRLPDGTLAGSTLTMDQRCATSSSLGWTRRRVAPVSTYAPTTSAADRGAWPGAWPIRRARPRSAITDVSSKDETSRCSEEAPERPQRLRALRTTRGGTPPRRRACAMRRPGAAHGGAAAARTTRHFMAYLIMARWAGS
jgi:hypothetical protein